MYNKLPKELKDNANFCLWDYETINGHKTKVPYQINGSKADCTNPHCFTDFDTVVNNVTNHDGIGMGIFAPYAAIDIDYCIKNGKKSEMARDIVETLNSYTEYSPSGEGIRIIVKAEHLNYDSSRYYINNHKIGLEVYVAGITNKYVTITGNAIRECDVAERPHEIMAVLDKYMTKPVVTDTTQINIPGSFLSDKSVMSKAMQSKQGEKFKALWNGHYTSSQSEADQALCAILAFWCGGDMEQMDRVFRKSKMYRNKWERLDYRNGTLKKAVMLTKEFYKPLRTDAMLDFNDAANTRTKLNVARNSRYSSGDIGFGRLYADIFKDVARYVPERKKWYIYEGKRWVADIGSLMAMELCKDLADAMVIYTASIKEEATRKYFLDVCKKWSQRHFREIYPVALESFDKNRYLLNCNNGTLELDTKRFREHKSSDYLTKICHVDYEPDSASERFDKFIGEIMSGDMERARFLQKALGYGIGGDTKYECMFFLYGELTRNGKGTLMESCLSVVGNYGRAVRPETIAQKHNANSQSPSEDVARLSGVRFANISEPSRGLVLNAAQVKSMTGNDTLNARFLNENSFDFKPQFKLYINTNYLPVISDTTLFSSGRIVIIPFNRHFEEWEQDKSLKAEFAKPTVQSAILNWLVKGYQLLQSEGFKAPQSVIDATESYSHESDKMARFVEERLTKDNSSEIRTAALYDTYKTWCYDNGCYQENSRNFNHELRKIGTVVRRRPKSGDGKTTLLIGFKLKDLPPLI